MTQPKPLTTADWAGDSAQRWLAGLEQLEGQLAPLSDLLFDGLAPNPSRRILDVGCGAGSTTRRAAELVDPANVTGIDVAAPLLEEARRRSGELPIEWICGDAQRTPAPREHDLVISRFGVMFFDDLAAAFDNLATWVRPQGKLRVVVWQRGGTSPLIDFPGWVCRRVLSEHGIDIDEEGPFDGKSSLGDPDRAREALRSWTHVTWTPHNCDLYLGGPGSVESAATAGTQVGPARRALDLVDPAIAAAVHTAMVGALAPFHDGTGVRLTARVAVIEATRQ